MRIDDEEDDEKDEEEVEEDSNEEGWSCVLRRLTHTRGASLLSRLT
jgi:hypothetical protein